MKFDKLKILIVLVFISSFNVEAKSLNSIQSSLYSERKNVTISKVVKTPKRIMDNSSVIANITISNKSISEEVKPVSNKTEAIVKPVVSDAHEVVVKPAVSNTSEIIIKPATSNSSEIIVKPAASNFSEIIDKPSASNSSEIIVKPAASNSSDIIVEPAASNSTDSNNTVIVIPVIVVESTPTILSTFDKRTESSDKAHENLKKEQPKENKPDKLKDSKNLKKMEENKKSS
jgi:hypothetical protein